MSVTAEVFLFLAFLSDSSQYYNL